MATMTTRAGGAAAPQHARLGRELQGRRRRQGGGGGGGAARNRRLGTRAQAMKDSIADLLAHKSHCSDEVLQTWKSCQAVCFDVDSTVSLDEGIDELADFCGAGPAVAEWTAKAMGGSVLFQDALKARLDLIQPAESAVSDFLAKVPPASRLSPGIAALVAKLQATGKSVFLVSGGFRQMINPIAEFLSVPLDQVYANNLLFNPDGSFRDFDREEYTSRSGGKAEAARAIKDKYGFEALAMVGDGSTDLEARQDGGADIFIGYGGVHVRDKVLAGSDWFVCSFDPLIAAL